MIKLPPHTWFVSAMEGHPCSNTLSGSAGTDPEKGNLHLKLFNYKVRVLDVGTENERMKADFWITQPFGLRTEPPEHTEKEFGCSDEAIAEIEAWLNENLEASDLS